MKKRVSALLLALMLLLSLTACGGSGGGSKSGPVTLTDAGATSFTIIYPAGAGETVMQAVKTLQDGLLEATGVEFPAYEDMAVGSGEGKSEILVGGTDRAASAEAATAFAYAGDYSVTLRDGKIVVSAVLDAALNDAAQRFTDAVAELSGDTLTLGGDFAITGAVDSALQYLPTFTDGTLLSSSDCGDDSTILVYDYNADGMAAYAAKLEKAGFTKYTENTIGDNVFTMYADESRGVEVTTMALPAMENFRIVATPITVLPATSAPTVEQKVTPSVSMLGLEGYDTAGSPNQIGMSFLYQLSDGSFLVVDGGHIVDAAADQLYELMQKLSPDGNITIAAWFVSHGHGDHMGALQRLVEKHAADITVELFVWNLPSESGFRLASEAVRDGRERLTKVAETMNAPVLKVHAGQKLYIRDAVVTMLCTQELVLPQSLEYFNDSSLVFSVELGGQKLMQLTDCGPLETPILLALYTNTDAMESELCQVGHHGYLGASSDLYRLINARYLLWPGGSRSYENYKDETYNSWALKNAEKTWIAGAEILTLTLPVA